MTSGGSRNRSGPTAGPDFLTPLPAAGYTGTIPPFPLTARRVMRWEFEDKRRFQVHDVETSAIVADREAELWEWAWRTPQAAMWAKSSWRWNSVAMWVRTFVICEGDEATAADKGAIHRFADQIGLTPAGLKENGWSITHDELAAKRAERENEEPEQAQPSARDRMKVGADGTGA